MALLNGETLRAQFESFSRLTALRQLGLMIGLAASVAIGTAIVLWSQQPNYGLLFGGLSGKEAGQVTQALQRAHIPYKIDPSSGAILVPSSKVYDARIKLATEGLPKGASQGFALLAKDQGAFGLSQFMETVRYRQALQQELERTIASLDSVESDRVHLAIPKQSVFIQDSPKASASVLVDLYAGRTLSPAQVAGIVHLVASSVAGLRAENVSVVDQRGNLLTGNAGPAAQQSGSALSAAQYDLTRRLDRLYARRIVDILAPIVGASGVRAQVTTTLDYALINTTSEKYDPKSQVVRSERTSENMRWGAASGGVPGALTNQPPPAGVPPQGAGGGQTPASPNGGGGQRPLLQDQKSATRNYEIDRTIRHIQQAPGVVKRLSVAVVVDYQSAKDAQGAVVSKPLTPQEMSNLTNLVKDAVGFDATRGDTVNVINAPFKQAAAAAPAPSGPPLWRQPWVWDVGKQVLGGLAVLLLIFGVLRPVMRSLVGSGGGMRAAAAAAEGAAGEQGRAVGDDRLSLTPQAAGAPPPDSYEAHLASARQVAQSDPKRVAQVVRSWVNEE